MSYEDKRPVAHVDPGSPAWWPETPANIYDADAAPPVTYGRTVSHRDSDAYRVIELALGGLYKIAEINAYGITNLDVGGGEVAQQGRAYYWDGSNWIESPDGLIIWIDSWIVVPWHFPSLPETTKIKLEIKTYSASLSKTKLFDVLANVEAVPPSGNSQIAFI